jgi:hypothetical protein
MDTTYTVKELIASLQQHNGDLPITLHIVKEVEEGVEEGTVFAIEAVGTDGEEVSLVGYDN